MVSSTLRQIWTISGVLLNAASTGFHLGYPTVLFRDLRAADSPIPLTLEAESWITSSIAITTLLSFVLIALIMERYGRKTAYIVLILPNIVACAMIYLASNVTILILARLILGIPNGGTIVLNAMIIAEFASPKIRGVLLNAKTCFIVFGTGYAHSLGLFFGWRTSALFGLLLPVPSLLITATWRESPAWLARHGYYEVCQENFVWLRGTQPNAQKELHALICTETNRRTAKTSDQVQRTFLGVTKNFFARFKRQDFLKPTWIVMHAFVIMEACGRHVFPTYAIKFIDAFVSGQSPLYYVVGLDLMILLTSIVSCVTVNLFKRRTLLFSTGSICSILLIVISLYLFIKSKGIVSTANLWIPFTLLVLYFIFLNLGASPIVLALLGEIYPLKHRSMGVVMGGLFFTITLMVVLKVTPILIETVEVYGTLAIFAIFMTGSLLYLYFYLPETKNKTLQEIEEYFMGSNEKIELAHILEKRGPMDNEI